jgi:hypothetical protein
VTTGDNESNKRESRGIFNPVCVDVADEMVYWNDGLFPKKT